MDKKQIEALNFIEDLCWLLDSKKKTSFVETAKLIEQLKSEECKNVNNQKISVISDDIIGILPRLLVDTTLFGTNKMLNQFADEVLGIEIKNWEKRSRNEMIGVIICQIQESNAKQLGVSAYLLENIFDKREEFSKAQKMKEIDNSPFTWNDAIHKIVGGNNE